MAFNLHGRALEEFGDGNLLEPFDGASASHGMNSQSSSASRVIGPHPGAEGLSRGSRVDKSTHPVTGRGSTLIIPFVFGCAILADRAVVVIPTGGQGVLPLVAIVAPLAAIVTLARYGSRRSLGFLETPAFVLAVLPYLVLTAVLPMLGVMFNGYPVRTLLATADATTAISFLVLGAAASSNENRSWAPWLLLAVVLQLAYTAGQAIYWARGPGWELFTPFARGTSPWRLWRGSPAAG